MTRAPVALACLAALAACHRAPAVPAPTASPTPSAAAAAGPSLYTRLGGVEAIRTVVGDFLGRIVADQRINAFFRGVDTGELAAKLTDQICQVSGGPCRYTGRPMREVHAGLGISDADFDALVEDLAAALDHFKVGPAEERELVTALGGLRRAIVTKR